MYVPPLPGGAGGRDDAPAGEQPRVYQVWRGSNVRKLYPPLSLPPSLPLHLQSAAIREELSKLNLSCLCVVPAVSGWIA